jgi:hypothetical protein
MGLLHIHKVLLLSVLRGREIRKEKAIFYLNLELWYKPNLKHLKHEVPLMETMLELGQLPALRNNTKRNCVKNVNWENEQSVSSRFRMDKS